MGRCVCVCGGGRILHEIQSKALLWPWFLKGFSVVGSYTEFSMSLFTSKSYKGPYLWNSFLSGIPNFFGYRKKLFFSSIYSFTCLLLWSFISSTHFTKVQAWSGGIFLFVHLEPNLPHHRYSMNMNSYELIHPFIPQKFIKCPPRDRF